MSMLLQCGFSGIPEMMCILTERLDVAYMLPECQGLFSGDLREELNNVAGGVEQLAQKPPLLCS
jgi:hypothetical protein